MPEITLTTSGSPAVNQPDLDQKNAGSGERDKQVGTAIRAGFTGPAVGELVEQGVAQQGQLHGRALTFMTGSDADVSNQATGSGPQSSLGNLLDRVRPSATGASAGLEQNTVSRQYGRFGALPLCRQPRCPAMGRLSCSQGRGRRTGSPAEKKPFAMNNMRSLRKK